MRLQPCRWSAEVRIPFLDVGRAFEDLLVLGWMPGAVVGVRMDHIPHSIKPARSPDSSMDMYPWAASRSTGIDLGEHLSMDVLNSDILRPCTRVLMDISKSVFPMSVANLLNWAMYSQRISVGCCLMCSKLILAIACLLEVEN